jgi:AcrR family transcriptional regulator
MERQSATLITREELAARALEILDRNGIDGLTMRGLAESLGVGTMTVYGYVRSKEEVLDAAVDAAVADAPAPAFTGEWRGDLRKLVMSAWTMLARHPALVQVRLRRPVLRPDALRFGEAGMALLQGAGLPAQDAAYAYRLLFTYTFGFAGLSPPADDDARRGAAAALAVLPAEDFPRLAAAREEFGRSLAGDEAFAYGLERILDGIGAQLAAVGGEA